MIVEIGNYRIEPYQSSMCWTLKKWRTCTEKGVETEKWCETGIYPTTYESALLRVREWLLMDKEDVCGIDAAIEALAKANKELVSALKRVGK